MGTLDNQEDFGSILEQEQAARVLAERYNASIVHCAYHAMEPFDHNDAPRMMHLYSNILYEASEKPELAARKLCKA